MIYTWRVWKNNRFAGYVVDISEVRAYIKAKEKFGDNTWIERVGK